MKYIHNIPTYREVEYEIATATTQEEIVALGKGGFEKYEEAHGVHNYRRVPRKREWYTPQKKSISFYNNMEENVEMKNVLRLWKRESRVNAIHQEN